MDTAISSMAWRIARFWADGPTRSEAAIRGFARQTQDHLDHGADPDHLTRLVGWLSLEHPDCLDLDLGLRYAGAPRPTVQARAAHACPCRGGPTRGGGAPAPALIRQLIRRTHQSAA